MSYLLKETASILDYKFDFTDDLDAAGGTISSFTVSIKGTVTNSQNSLSHKAVTVWLSGGTSGEVCYITVTIVSTNSRTFTATKPIRIA